MKVSQQELNQHKEQLKSYLQQIIYAHDQKPLELSIPFGKSMEAERDMVIAATYASDLILHDSPNYELDAHIYTNLCRYFGTDIAEDGIFCHQLERASEIDAALANLATLIFISNPDIAQLMAEDQVSSLYIVGFEGSYDWSNWKACLDSEDFEQGRSFTVFYDDDLTINCGWSEEQEKELAETRLFETLQSFGEHSHTMIKLA